MLPAVRIADVAVDDLEPKVINAALVDAVIRNVGDELHVEIVVARVNAEILGVVLRLGDRQLRVELVAKHAVDGKRKKTVVFVLAAADFLRQRLLVATKRPG